MALYCSRPPACPPPLASSEPVACPYSHRLQGPRNTASELLRRPITSQIPSKTAQVGHVTAANCSASLLMAAGAAGALGLEPREGKSPSPASCSLPRVASAAAKLARSCFGHLGQKSCHVDQAMKRSRKPPFPLTACMLAPGER